MKVTDAIATAVANGWSDDSRWAPKDLQASLTRVEGTQIAGISIYRTGKIRWAVQPAPGAEGKVVTGRSRTVLQAIDATAAALSTLL